MIHAHNFVLIIWNKERRQAHINRVAHVDGSASWLGFASGINGLIIEAIIVLARMYTDRLVAGINGYQPRTSETADDTNVSGLSSRGHGGNFKTARGDRIGDRIAHKVGGPILQRCNDS